MRLIPRYHTFESEKNGTVSVLEFLWRVEVYAGGFEQSGPYVVGLWREALQHVQRADVQSILIIGLCAGDNVRLAQKHFPNADITVVEWDSAMINMALSLRRFKSGPTIIHGDLREVLPTLNKQFDVILSDAFYGDQPDVGADTNVGEVLTRILAPGGTYLLNASRTQASIGYISHFLIFKKKWRFRDNTVALFTH